MENRENDLFNKILNTHKKYLKPIEFPTEKCSGRKNELELMEETMLKKRMNNILLIGNAGTGKTMLVQEYARRHKDEVIILTVSTNGLVAGTQFRGSFEEKVHLLLEDVSEYNRIIREYHYDKPIKPIILFIDEIHTIINLGASSCVPDSTGLDNILKPYLSSNKITLIGATTQQEYDLHIRQDKALVRRLGVIKVKALCKERIMEILKNFSEGIISDEYLNYIFDESLKLYGDNPDLSIEICDRAMAKAKRLKSEKVTKKHIDQVIASMEHK